MHGFEAATEQYAAASMQRHRTPMMVVFMVDRSGWHEFHIYW
jgi:hypothetical protein